MEAERRPAAIVSAGVHPLERLRHVARTSPLSHRLLVEESAAALAGLGGDPGALLLSCRRLLERQPACGPLWWLCARLLSAGDTVEEAWLCVEELDRDTTAHVLAAHLPQDATVVVLGWLELTAGALAGGNLQVRVVEGEGESPTLSSDLVIVEASAMGPDGWVGPMGSRATLDVASSAGIPVWVVAGVGRVLPTALWSALTARLVASKQPWVAGEEVVPLDLVTAVIRPAGRGLASEPRPADCPEVAELR